MISRPNLRRTSALAIAATLCLACTAHVGAEPASDADAPVATGSTSAPPFTDVVYGNNYPKHIHLQSFRNKTYITLSATAEDEPFIWSVDHETGQWQGPVQVGLNQLPVEDMHGNPSLVVDDDGYIHVWYGGHGSWTSERVYARSARPEDIGEWIHPDFETDMTYPMPWVLSDGTIGVLYRAGNHAMPGSSAWVVQNSTDNGLTWSKPRVIVQRLGRDTDADVYAIPVKYPGEDKVGIGLSDEYMRGSMTVHTTSDLFYVVYDAANDTLHNVAGRPLEAPDGLSIGTLREHCVVADYKAMGNYNKRISARPAITADGAVYVWASNGNPAGFAPRPADFDPTADLPKFAGRKGRPANFHQLTYGGKHRLWRWDGKQWQHADPKPRLGWPNTREGALLAWGSVDSNTRALMRSKDHGATWRPVAQAELPIEKGQRVGVFNITGHRPAHSDARAVFYERRKEGRSRAWLWGDSGFLAPPAPLSEASMPASVTLQVMKHNLEIQATEQPGAAASFTMPVANLLNQPLSVHVQPLPGSGEGWRIEGVPVKAILGPGETRSIDLQMTWKPGTVRYPLPTVDVTLAVPEAEPAPDPVVTRMAPPMLGTNPPLVARRLDAVPTLDGRLEDRAWRRAPDVPAMGRMDLARQIEPRTRVWLGYDDRALYIAFHCEEKDPDRLRVATRTRDGKVFQDDSIEVMLEPDGDGEGRDYRQIVVNPAGVIFDGQGFDKAVDLSGLRAATAVGDDHWSAEIAIPWADLGLDGPPESPRILLGRNRWATGDPQISQFPVSPRGNHQPGYFARLRLQEDRAP